MMRFHSINLRELSCRGAESIWHYIVSPIRRRYGSPPQWGERPKLSGGIETGGDVRSRRHGYTRREKKKDEREKRACAKANSARGRG